MMSEADFWQFVLLGINSLAIIILWFRKRVVYEGDQHIHQDLDLYQLTNQLEYNDAFVKELIKKINEYQLIRSGQIDAKEDN